MAETSLSVTDLNRSGVEESLGAIDESNGNSFALTGKEFVIVDNSDASPHSITFTDQEASNRGFLTDKTVAVPAGERHVIGPFKKQRWQDSSGNMILSYSAGAQGNLTIQVLRNPDASSDADTES